MGARGRRPTNADDRRADGGRCGCLSAFRTVKDGHTFTKISDWIVASISFLALPCAIGWVCRGILPPPQSLTAFPDDLAYVYFSVGLLCIGPVFSIFALLPAIFIARTFLRIGWAGWATMAAVSSACALLPVYILGASAVGSPSFLKSLAHMSFYAEAAVIFAAIHALALWSALRVSSPTAFAPRKV